MKVEPTVPMPQLLPLPQTRPQSLLRNHLNTTLYFKVDRRSFRTQRQRTTCLTRWQTKPFWVHLFFQFILVDIERGIRSGERTVNTDWPALAASPWRPHPSECQSNSHSNSQCWVLSYCYGQRVDPYFVLSKKREYEECITSDINMQYIWQILGLTLERHFTWMLLLLNWTCYTVLYNNIQCFQWQYQSTYCVFCELRVSQ